MECIWHAPWIGKPFAVWYREHREKRWMVQEQFTNCFTNLVPAVILQYLPPNISAWCSGGWLRSWYYTSSFQSNSLDGMYTSARPFPQWIYILDSHHANQFSDCAYVKFLQEMKWNMRVGVYFEPMVGFSRKAQMHTNRWCPLLQVLRILFFCRRIGTPMAQVAPFRRFSPTRNSVSSPISGLKE